MQRTNWYHVKSILRQTWDHPSNADRRVRAVVGAMAWQIDKRTRRRPRDVAFFGCTLRCQPDSQSASNVIYFTERFDPDEMAFIEAYLRPGDGFLDVGANIGTYSLLARSLVGATGRVDGFEPHPVAARRFRENVELNGFDNVEIHETAVGATAGVIEFLDGADVSNRARSDVDGPRPVVEVPVVRLDDVLGSRRYAMGKIDVEGYEAAAFAGAVEHLGAANPPVWQIEVLDHQLRKFGSSGAAVRAHLEHAGYRLGRIVPASGASPVGLEWNVDSDTPAVNVVAVHTTAIPLVEDRLGVDLG